ncbi:MAG: hypothetical protein U9N85_09545 [Bacteroidota bacterium]|nr:hypothetical protein [Bacteroidota bacterium]
MKQTIFLTATILIFIISSCKNDENANAKFSVKQKETTLKSTKSETFDFTKALIGISEIDFEIEPDSEDQDFEYEGKFQFDILTGTSSPAISSVEIAPGTYHELEIDVDNVLTSGKSIEIFGTYNGIKSAQFEFTSTLNEDYDVQNTTGIKATTDETVNFVLYLDLEALFDGVDFTAADVDNDNIIRINASSNSDLASIIENNLDDNMDYDND